MRYIIKIILKTMKSLERKLELYLSGPCYYRDIEDYEGYK